MNQVHTSIGGDMTITGDLYRGRRIGERAIRKVENLRSGQWVTFDDGEVRVFRTTLSAT